MSANIKLLLKLVSEEIVNQNHSFKNKPTHTNQTCSSADHFFFCNKQPLSREYVKMDKIIWSGYSQEEKNGIWYSTQAHKTIAILFTLKEYVCCCCPVIACEFARSRYICPINYSAVQQWWVMVQAACSSSDHRWNSYTHNVLSSENNPNKLYNYFFFFWNKGIDSITC